MADSRAIGKGSWSIDGGRGCRDELALCDLRQPNSTALIICAAMAHVSFAGSASSVSFIVLNDVQIKSVTKFIFEAKTMCPL